MQASSSRTVGRKVAIVLALASHASLNYTLCLRAIFAPVLLTLS